MVEERPAKRVKSEHGPQQKGQRNRQAGKWKNHKAQAGGKSKISSSGIHNDDVGVFITCDKGQERRCLNEAHDLFSQYLDLMTSTTESKDVQLNSDVPENDVEADIQAELDALKGQSADQDQFQLVTLDVPCLSFVKVPKGLDPVALVHNICSDAYDNPARKRSRHIKRMTPMSLMRKTLSDGLEEICPSVLIPHFGLGRPSKKFAIRPTIRNNNDLDRDSVIKTVAKAVGNNHSVDLKGYDLLILVDVYRNVCGMSVVGNDYEKLKRFNLSEIYSPTPKPVLSQTKKVSTKDTAEDIKGTEGAAATPSDDPDPVEGKSTPLHPQATVENGKVTTT